MPTFEVDRTLIALKAKTARMSNPTFERIFVAQAVDGKHSVFQTLGNSESYVVNSNC